LHVTKAEIKVIKISGKKPTLKNKLDHKCGVIRDLAFGAPRRLAIIIFVRILTEEAKKLLL
jgi:hypothetical protein